MIIKFYDSLDDFYPFIEIKDKDEKAIKKILEKYQEEEEYNFDDFISILKEKGFKIKQLNYDVEWFF